MKLSLARRVVICNLVLFFSLKVFFNNVNSGVGQIKQDLVQD